MNPSSNHPVFGKRIAIANRAEIAIRIAATCRRLGAIPIVLLGDPDLESLAAREIGLVEPLGPAGAEFEVERVIATASKAGAELLHPGYGFLSERAELSAECERAGIIFVGPGPETLHLCGDKLATRLTAERVCVPLLPASDPLDDDPGAWVAAALAVGYPLLVKPAGAGGGRGLRRVAAESDLEAAIAASRRESAASGAGDRVYLEQESLNPRHVEVQIAGDGTNWIALGDRDCSIQRRHQKVIEEAPAPNVPDETRRALHEHAVKIGEAVGLQGIATCEFLLGPDGSIAFLEVNPRIQVEHPVTELVSGVDLVEWQLRIAAGHELPSQGTPEPRGHAIEARVYAEDPWNGFFPSAGRLTAMSWPGGPGIRIDAGYARGDVVPSTYDPMLAKVIAHGSDRAAALASLEDALRGTVIAGVTTNIPWLLNLVRDEDVQQGVATISTASGVAPTMPDRRFAVAAAVASMLEGARTDAVDAWSAIGPWRMSGDQVLEFHGQNWESRVPIRRSERGWKIELEGSKVELRWWRDSDGVFTVRAGQETGRFAIESIASGMQVTGNGGSWKIRSGPRAISPAAARSQRHDGRLRAPLPATVQGIHVTVGETVHAGQALVTLSAMKIEMICEATVAGVIEAVNCRVNDQVAADGVLVVIRPESA